MDYDIILFDADDTLFNFRLSQRNAFSKLCKQQGYTFSDELFQLYDSVNQQLWEKYENGKIGLADVINSRFSETMGILGKIVDGVAWENMYVELLGNCAELMEGALELCQRLSVSHRLFIITNGMCKTQSKRLKQSGLYPLFEGVFDSQSIGFPKPAKEFFDYVKSNIKEFDIKKTLIVGDSLKADIKGGNDAGIDTCWFNHKEQKRSEEIQSTYTIRSLREVYGILKVA